MTNSAGSSLALQVAFSRHLIKFPWQLALALVGISAGVAVVVAIQLVRVSAYESFEQASLLNNGEFSHRIENDLSGRIPYLKFVELKTKLPFTRMSPVVHFQARTNASADSSSLYILGIDPISRGASRQEGSRVSIDAERFLSEKNGAYINRVTAQTLRLYDSNSLTLEINGEPSRLNVLELLPNQDQVGGIANQTVLVDIATAQELLGIGKDLTRIDLDLTTADAARVQQMLDGRYTLIDNHHEAIQLRSMTQAFYTNLTALSLMALLMGMFLIYNTETFLVLQRQQMIARFKALGVSNREILVTTIIEATLLGLLGSIVGLLLGYLLANGLLKVVSITLSDFYYQSSANEVIIAPVPLAIGLGLGVMITVIAAALPARTAARSPFVASLHRTSNSPSAETKLRYFVLGSLVFYIIAGYTLTSYTSIYSGFFAITCVLLGSAVLCIPILFGITTIFRHHGLIPNARFLFEKIGLRTARLSLTRTGPATAALMIATAAAIGIGVMVASFRLSVTAWLENSLRADYYLSTEFSLAQKSKGISPQAKRLIADVPGVEKLSTVTRTRVSIRTEDGTHTSAKVRVTAFELNDKAKLSFRFLDRNTIDWQEWEQSDRVVITEPFAHRYAYRAGEFLTLNTPLGLRDFKILGVYKDYASEQGSIAISRAVYEKYWPAKAYDGIGIYTDGSVSQETLQAHLNKHAELEKISLLSSSALLQRSLQVFDRTFLITNLLKIITIVVAFIGIVGALLAQQLERSHEYGIYRALGFNRSEVIRLILSQTFTIGIIAALVAIPTGLAVAFILTDVINPRSFGWTMTTVVPLGTLSMAALTAISAALIAGIFPALRIVKLAPSKALRFE